MNSKQKLVLNTLCFPICNDNNKILLGYKKRGFGKGYWNGFGGKLKKQETLEQATIRETQEEARILCKQLIKMAVLEFEFIQTNLHNVEGHVYICREFQEPPVFMETEEMRPQWFAIKDIPFASMWSDDILWLPHVLAGKKLRAHFIFNKEFDVQDYHMDFIDNNK